MANMTSIPAVLILLLTLAGVTRCSEELKATDDYQYLETNGFSFYWYYLDNMNEEWTIEAVGMYHKVEISELYFNIEYCDGCVCDYLQLFDGDSERGTTYDKYCGINQYPTTVTSTGKYMHIKFVSDAQNHYYRGFTLKYRRIEEKNAKTWVIVGITMTVLVVMISVSLIVYLCYKKHNQVTPINAVHYRPGNVQHMPQVVWTTSPQRIVLPPYPGHVVEPDGRNVIPAA